jgi:hypothetical protein
MPGHEPVEPVLEAREATLHRQGRKRLARSVTGLSVRQPALEVVDELVDVEALDGGEGEMAAITPGREAPDGIRVGAAGVLVAAMRGQEPSVRSGSAPRSAVHATIPRSSSWGSSSRP